MAKKSMEKKMSTDEKYIRSLFAILKRRDYISFMDKNSRFNDAEIRVLSEIISAKYDGRRLISTQLAQNLGVTRSAISQIVNRMEKNGVLKRVPDDIDRKIAYIEITDERLQECDEDLKLCTKFLSKVIEKFGEGRFNEMCNMVNEFMDIVQKERDLVE